MFTRQPIKSVGLHALVTAVRDYSIGQVEFEIAFRRRQRVGADVQVRHRFCAAPRSVKREAAGKAERVQYVAPAGKSFDFTAVFALIQKKSSFLSANDVDFKADSVFQKHDRFGCGRTG